MGKRLSAVWETQVWKIPWRRRWQPTPVLLPGKSHGQRSLVGYSLWGLKESDTTEQLHFFFHFLLLEGPYSVLCSLMIAFESIWEVCASRPLNILVSKTLTHGLKEAAVKQHSVPGDPSVKACEGR